MLLVFVVLKLDKLSDVNERHSQNMYCIFVTDEVSKLDTFNSDKFQQPLNIKAISLTFVVSNFDRFKELNWKHQ